MHSSLFGLTAFRQFVVYKIVPKPTGKSDKLPVCSKTGNVVSAHDPQYWLDAATAEAIAAQWGPQFGVGFVFTDNDPFWFLDIDGALVDGAWSPLAIALCGSFPGCALEVSGSHTGLHIIGRGIPPAHGCKNKPLDLEFYHTGRFVALTGINAAGDCMTDGSAILPALVAQYFPADAVATGESGWTEGPCEGWYGPIDDKELIRRAMNSRSTASAFSGKASFADLWLANEQALAVSYPTGTPGEPYGASEADAGLAQHLAFWTGNDCDRIDRLMRKSKLARDKWDSHKTYMERTIRGAVARQSDVCRDKTAPAAGTALAAPVTGSLTVPDGTPSEMTPEDFISHLPSHKYINRFTREHHSVDAINGNLSRFKDGFCQGWKPAAWLDTFRSVQQMSWHPGYPEIIEGMISDHGELVPNPKGRIYNLYRPTDAVAIAGDVSRWIAHIQYLYPTDWEYIMQWMAYRVQHPGEKINHALVIGGTPRTGKDMIFHPLKYGVGTSNLQTISPLKMFKDFNDWVECTLLVINEAKDLGEDSRYTFENTLKPYIAAPPTTLTCNKKNQQPYQIPNVMCVVVMTNYKLDGIYIPADDGRYYVAWSDATRRTEPGYYDSFFRWLDEEGGKQACYGHLMAMDVSGFKPKDNPPKTEAWHQIVAAGRNQDETILGDVIEGLKLATLNDIKTMLQLSGNNELLAALNKSNRRIGTVLGRVGMDALPNPDATDGRWRLGDGRKETLYVARGLSRSEALQLANRKMIEG